MPKRYCSFTVEYKISVVEWHGGNGSVVSKTADQFSIDRKCEDWNAKYEELKRHEATLKGKKARKMRDGREPLSVELDDQVFDFLQERRSFGLAVSNVALIDEAKRVAAELNIVRFIASNG